MNKIKRHRGLPILCLFLAGTILISGCGSHDGSSKNSAGAAQASATEKQEGEKAQFEISKLSMYDANGACTLECSFEYNQEGKLIHQVQDDYKSGDILESEMFYRYPESNRQIRTYIDKVTGKRTQSDEAVYNDDGQMLTESHFSYDENGSEENDYSQSDYFYDENGNLLSKEIYNTSKIGANVTSKQITQYTYDKEGNRISEQSRSVRDGQEDSVWLDYTYEYDKNGNKIRAVSAIINENTDSPIIYSYNNKNLLVKESAYISTEPTVLNNYYTYEYDENDNLIKCIRYSADDQIISYTEYEYIEIGAISSTTEAAVSNISLYQKWHIDGTAASSITFKIQADSSDARCEIEDFDLYTQEEVDGMTSTSAEITEATIVINYRPDEYVTFTYAFQKDGTLKFTNQETGKTFSMHLI